MENWPVPASTVLMQLDLRRHSRIRYSWSASADLDEASKASVNYKNFCPQYEEDVVDDVFRSPPHPPHPTTSKGA